MLHLHLKECDSTQHYLKENFKDFLENSGFNPQEGYFPNFEFPFDISSIEKKASEVIPKNYAFESKIRDFFNRWFIGLRLKQFKPLLKAGPSSFILNFNKPIAMKPSA